MGKKGLITVLMKELSRVSLEERSKAGKILNVAKNKIEQKLFEKKELWSLRELNNRLSKESLDITLPERKYDCGTIHPISKSLNEIICIMGNLGFSIEDGPHIEDDYHNFTALNIPKNHPARQDHDTFYVKSDSKDRKVLRTHTSPVQIRTMEKKKPPIRILAAGSTYRCDDDSTHSPMFHQVEALALDKNLNMGHLKGVVIELLTTFFGNKNLPIRFRPSYFPFTEPSVEVDIGYSKKNGILRIGEGEEWLEVMGCGIVNPKVLENCGIDSNQYSGFALGLGVERFTMLKSSIIDLRSFFNSDIRWLKKFGSHPVGFPSLLRGI